MMNIKRFQRHYLKIIFLIGINLCSSSLSAQENFDAWLMEVEQQAVLNGVSTETAKKVCQHIQFLPNVIELDRAQPEFISPFLAYYHQRVDAKKVQLGREKLIEYQPLLNQLVQRYGVPKEILVAFWGMETNYGKNQGHTAVISSLATLGFEGRRAAFFRQQLIDAMRIIDEKNIEIDAWQGSWAGAFGHMQFMPSTFTTYAVDGDGDAHIDLIQSEVDALTSAANYLSQVGWQPNQPAVIEVQLPENFAMQQAQLNLKKPVAEWMQLGVVAIQGKKITKPIARQPHKNKIKSKTLVDSNQQFSKLPDAYVIEKTTMLNKVILDSEQQAAILLPQGWRGPAFMVFDNFDALMDWNRSVNYALSVAQLAQQINAQTPVLGGIKAETGALSYLQMQQLQIMLNALGFDAGAPDGFPGLQTQSAIRAYQLTQQLPADGYASLTLYHQLNQQNVNQKMVNQQQ